MFDKLMKPAKACGSQSSMVKHFLAYLRRLILTCSSLLILVCMGLSGCHPAPQATELFVSSAVSLKDAMTEIAAEFEQTHPGTKVVFNFGSSGELARQITQGAPADLFISAAPDQIRDLIQAKLISAPSIHECCGNQLVVIAPADRHFSSLGDLARAGRVAIGNPQTVPCGQYARSALEKAGLYSTLAAQSKLVLAEDARQILAYVEGGDVDAGIVYNTDAMLAKRSKVCFTIPASYTGRMFYSIAPINSSSHKELAAQFLSFVIGPQAKKAFQERGFSP